MGALARRRRHTRALRLESLEERALLATFTVANTENSGPGSLRQALADADANQAVRDTIVFDIPSDDPGHVYYRDDGVSGQVTLDNVTPTTAATDDAIADIDPDWPHSWYTIRLSDLNGITYPVTIDGYSQPGSVKNTSPDAFNGVLRIELDGSDLEFPHLFNIRSGNTFQGLVINRVARGHAFHLGGNDNNTIVGNLIGTDPSGTLAIGNPHGIVTGAGGGDHNRIGGTTPDLRNVISGNKGPGVWLDYPATNTIVQGNLIGTAADGVTPLGNDGVGVFLSGTGFSGVHDSTIGGPEPGAGNVIAFNNGDGVSVGGVSDNILIQGNRIYSNGRFGVHSAGMSIIVGNEIRDNEQRGVNISGADSRIESNTITGNGTDGVGIGGTGAITVLSNSISDNGGLGINLFGGTEDGFGVTANDPLDADDGPNGLQNFPMITSAARVTGGTRIEGVLSSAPDSRFRLEFFAIKTVDPSGHGEGETPLGTIDVQTDAAGNIAFSEVVPGEVPAGSFITATATRLTQVGNAWVPGATSEFSPSNENPVAGSIAWDGGGDGFSWSDPLNWVGDLLPGPNEDVLIDVSDADPEIVIDEGLLLVGELVSHEPLKISGGTLALSGDSELFSDLTLTDNGTLSGDGTLTVHGAFTWTGGTMSGVGTTISDGEWNIAGSATKTVGNARTLVNRGRLTWSGRGEVFRGTNEPTFRNEAGAVFSVETDSDFFSGPTPGGLFVNEGALRRTVGAGTSSIKSPVTNRGTIVVSSGTLRLSAGFIQEAGSTVVEMGTIESTSEFVVAGGTLAGSGTIRGDVRNAGLVQPGGEAQLDTLYIVGDYAQDSSGVLEIDVSDAPGSDVLQISGTASLDGTMRVVANSVALPAIGSEFDVVSFAQVDGGFGTLEGIDYPGAVFNVESRPKSLALVVSDGINATEISQQLADGLQTLQADIANWFGAFNLDVFSESGVPIPEVPGIDRALATAFSLVEQGQSLTLPSVTPVTSIAEFKSQLDELKLPPSSVMVDCLAGADTGEAACAPGDFVQLRWEHTLTDLAAQVPWDGTTAPGILDGLADSLDLSGDLDLIADATLTIIVGVDERGFYVDSSSGIDLHITGDGSVGTGAQPPTVAGVPTEVAGTVAIDATVRIAPHLGQERHRIQSITGDPPALLVPSATGQTTVDLDALVGPAQLMWQSVFTVEASPRAEHSLSADVPLAGWQQLHDDGTTSDAQFHLDGSRTGTTWKLEFDGDGEFRIPNGVIALVDPSMTLTLSDSDFQGTAGGRLAVQAAESGLANSIAVNLSGSVTPDRMEWQAAWDPGSLMLKRSGTEQTAIALASPHLVAGLGAERNAELDQWQPFASLAMTSDSATAFPGAPITGQLGGVSADLFSNGVIEFDVATFAADFGTVFHLESSPVHFDYNGAASDTDVFLTVGPTEVSLPDLERGGVTPTLAIPGFGFRHDGTAFLGDGSAENHPNELTLTLPESYPDIMAIGGLATATIDKVTFHVPADDLTRFTAVADVELDLAPLAQGLATDPQGLSVTITDTDGSPVDTTAHFDVALSGGGLAVGQFRAGPLGSVTLTYDGLPVSGVEGSGFVTVDNIDAEGQAADVTGEFVVTTKNHLVFPENLTIGLEGTVAFDDGNRRARLNLDGIANLNNGNADARAVFSGEITTGLGVGSGTENDFGVAATWELVEGSLDTSIDFEITDLLRLTGSVIVTTGGVTTFADAEIDFIGPYDAWPTIGVDNAVLQADGSVKIDSASLALGDVSLGTLVDFNDLIVNINDLEFASDGTLKDNANPSVEFTAQQATVLPTSDVFDIEMLSLKGTVAIGGSDSGKAEITGSVMASVSSSSVVLSAPDDGATLTLDPHGGADDELLSVAAGMLQLTLENGKQLGLSATDARLQRDGDFTLDSASLSASQGIASAFGVAGILPFDVTDVTLTPVGEQSPILLNQFTAEVRGQFDFSRLDPLIDATQGELVLSIGGTKNVDQDHNSFDVDDDDLLDENQSTFDFTFSFDATRPNPLQIEDLGPIFLGLRNMQFGPMTVGAWIELGGYQNGQFSSDFAASADVRFQSAVAELAGAITVAGSLDLTSSAEAVLDVGITVTASFAADVLPVSFEDLKLSFDTSLLVNRQTFETIIEQPTLTGLSAETISINVFDTLHLVAHNASIGLGPDEPFLKFGGDETTQEGALELVFGDTVGALEGLGGSIGNFGVGFTLGDTPEENDFDFYALDGFFVKVTIPEDFKFGLPDWLPLEVREIGMRFDQSPADVVSGLWSGTTRFEDLTDVALLFSGGLKGTDIFPITAQVEDVVVDIEKLVDCMETYIDSHTDPETGNVDWTEFGSHVAQSCGGDNNPITNLDLVEFGIEEFHLGTITIGGALGFGLIDVPLDASDPAGPSESVYYGRVMGKFAYGDSGIGVELIVTQYGPVLARVFAGVPIPIGMVVGAIVGSVVPGIGTSAGATVGKQTGFVLTGLEGGFIFGDDPLPVVEKPIEILEQGLFHDPFDITIGKVVDAVGDAVRKSKEHPENPTYTWSDGFTFAGSAVLTNEYIGGLVGGRLTLGANVGYADQVGAQLFGIGDLEVVGIDLASVGVLFDYREPLEPTFNLAFALPGTPGNPLSVVLPVEGQFGARIETTGVSEAAATAIAAVFDTVASRIEGSAAAGLEYGQEFFATVLDVMAKSLDSHRRSLLEPLDTTLTELDSAFGAPRRLATLVLDANSDGTLSIDELKEVADTPVLLADQMIQKITQSIIQESPAPAIELADAAIDEILDFGSQLLAAVGSDVAEDSVAAVLRQRGIELGADAAAYVSSVTQTMKDFAASIGQPGSGDTELLEIINEFSEGLLPEGYQAPRFDSSLALAGSEFIKQLAPTDEQTEFARKILALLRKPIVDGIKELAETIPEFWERDDFDPSLTIEGALQPTVLGIPIGDPEATGSLRLDKHGLTVDIDTTLASLSAPFAVHPYSAAALAAIIAVGSDPKLGMSMSLPIGNVIKEILFPGITSNDTMPGDASVLDSLLEPFDQDWGYELRTTMRIFHFDTAVMKGLAVIPPLGEPRKQLNDFAEERIQKLWGTNEDDEIDPTKIPIFDQTHYQALLDYGGILLSGLIRVPKIITDPVEFLSQKQLQLPEDAGPVEYANWTQSLIAALDDADTPGVVQIFLPSMASAIDIDLDADPASHNALASDDCVLPEMTQDGARFKKPAANELPPTCRVHLTEPQELDEGNSTLDQIEANLAEIQSTAYFEGAWGQFDDPAGKISDIGPAKILGIPVGKGKLSWTEQDGLTMTFQEPLLGIDVDFHFDSRSADGSSGSESSDTRLPTVFAGLDLSFDTFADALGNLGFPDFVVNAVAGNSGAGGGSENGGGSAGPPTPYFRAFSPGYSSNANGSPLSLTGGVELGGRIVISALLEADTAIHYAMGIGESGLPEVQSFSGQGTVASFTPFGPLVPADLLSFEGVTVGFEKSSSSLPPAIELGGTLNLFGRSFSLDPQDSVAFSDDGVVGTFDLVRSTNDPVSIGVGDNRLDNRLEFDGDVEFGLSIDTRAGHQSVITASGHATLGGFGIDGTFTFGVASGGGLSIRVTGDVVLPVLGSFSITRGSLELDAEHVAAALQLEQSTPAGIGDSLQISGSFEFLMNSFAEAKILNEGTPNEVEIAAGSSARIGGAAQVAIPSIELDLSGELGFSTVDGGFKADIGPDGMQITKLFGVSPNTLPDWLFPDPSALKVASGSFDLLDADVGFDNMQLFDVDGAVDLLGGIIDVDVDATIDGLLSNPASLLTGHVAGSLSWRIPLPNGSSKIVNVGSVGGTLDAYGCLTASIDTSVYQAEADLELVDGACGSHLSIAGSLVREDDGGSEAVEVRLSRPASENVTIDYAVEMVASVPGDLGQADASDFHIETGSVTLHPGDTSVPINVSIVSDDDIEFDEVLQVRILNAGSLPVDVSNEVALVVIVNDDQLEQFPQISPLPFLAYDFETEHDYEKLLPEAGPDAESKVAGSSVDSSRVVPAGLSQFIGDDSTAPRRTVRSFGYELAPQGQPGDTLEFTVTLPHRTKFEELRFWSSPLADDSQPQPEWNVRWSFDNFADAMAAPVAYEVSSDEYGEDFAKVAEDGGIAEGLLGWQKHVTSLSTASTGLLCGGPGDVSVRIANPSSETVYLDNIELFAHTSGPQDNCFDSSDEVVVSGQVVELLDPVYGEVILSLGGPGTIDVSFLPLSPGDGVTDPPRVDQITSVALTGTTSTSQLRVTVENTRAKTPLVLGDVTADGPMGSFFARGVPSLLGTFQFASLGSFIARKLESGSTLTLTDDHAGPTSLMLFGDVGTVDLTGSGMFDVAARSWSGGTWTVGELADVQITDGDLGASMSVARGFGSIDVLAGDIVSRTIETGTSPVAGDGSGGMIRAHSDAFGEGGSILTSNIVIDGSLSELSAMGGNLVGSVSARHIDNIVSSSLDGFLGGGDITGSITVDSFISMSSHGGTIGATLRTLDAEHDPVTILAEPDAVGRGGFIDSQNSFHIAGKIAEISAHDIRLHLDAGRSVGLIEITPNNSELGEFRGSFSAQSFGAVRGEARSASFTLFSREGRQGADPKVSIEVRKQPSGSGEGEEAGAPDDIVMIDIQAPEGIVQVGFDGSSSGSNAALSVDTLQAVLVPADAPGAPLIELGETMQGPFEVTDDRFEVVGKVLKLKAGQALAFDDSGSMLTVSEVDRPSVKQTFVLDVVDMADLNPWHNAVIPTDVNGDGVTTPRDALLVIDGLSNEIGPSLPIPVPGPHDFLDVTGDLMLSPIDVLSVIEELTNGT